MSKKTKPAPEPVNPTSLEDLAAFFKKTLAQNLDLLVDMMNKAREHGITATFSVKLGSENKYVIGDLILTKTF